MWQGCMWRAGDRGVSTSFRLPARRNEEVDPSDFYNAHLQLDFADGDTYIGVFPPATQSAFKIDAAINLKQTRFTSP